MLRLCDALVFYLSSLYAFRYDDSLQEERRDGILRTRATQNTRQTTPQDKRRVSACTAHKSSQRPCLWSPPVTTPLFLNHCHACPGCFPLQPVEKRKKNLQLSVVSSTDINVVLSVVMQRLKSRCCRTPSTNRRALVSDVPRHGHALRRCLPHATGIWQNSVPLLINGLRIVQFFEHLAASHDGFAQLLHVRPQSAKGIPPAPLH